MQKITTLAEIDAVQSPRLKEHLRQTTETMFDAYGIDSMDSIGYYLLLKKDEYAAFPIADMEFVEMLNINGESYLHGVKVLSEDCAEDYYLPIEVISK